MKRKFQILCALCHEDLSEKGTTEKEEIVYIGRIDLLSARSTMYYHSHCFLEIAGPEFMPTEED